ncbi:protein-export chaperone SecB [Kingella negevensis]|uniref:Protein-export protein SecB n=1 Tax=Kingella negevensis TaxID=1522312 RepID=A0A238HHI7_9NEIS|nr:protein-export chaperone SecB [Kingella negevensis]MDK4679632.1 protein-export chaperone SecB [Kingella negevensis]MDK4682649.1 protein-export chaperone SecB [Kingella negevensis]MDK4684192.1 protein-export chaperone SecB [Kingella negevensis]MDK4690846.1 protein-export chaperone SecB [Kingella negevensis]MDK4694007.1 protein-export chaperone SecB [Kingella negevensis]
MSNENQAPVQAQENAPAFSVEKLYVKDLSLEVPHAPAIFLEQETPEVDMRITTNHDKIEEGFYDCSITVTVTAKLSDNRVVFLSEVTQAGIFQVANIPEEDVSLLLGVACPNILFPYAREAVSSTVTRAGFPPVLLAPINFDAMYHQAQEQKAQ